jgi:hypothetical protein
VRDKVGRGVTDLISPFAMPLGDVIHSVTNKFKKRNKEVESPASPLLLDYSSHRPRTRSDAWRKCNLPTRRRRRNTKSDCESSKVEFKN